MCVMLFMALIASLIGFVVPFIKAWFERFLGLVYNVLFRPLSPISIFCFVSTFPLVIGNLLQHPPGERNISHCSSSSSSVQVSLYGI